MRIDSFITKPSQLALLAVTGTIMLTSCGSRDQGLVIKNRGSDTLVQVAQAWAEVYKDAAGVQVQVSGGGSGTGITGLINGNVDIANSSRAIKDKEKKQIVEKYGKEAKEFIVGFDGIAVFTHKSNPITEVTMDQLFEIYGEGGNITNWEQVNPAFKGEIQRASRQNNSGTYAFFQEAVCKGGEFKQGANNLSGSKEVVEFCTATPTAIGYSGMGYKTDAQNWLKIAGADGVAYEPTIANVQSKKYPIARPLYLYTIGEPEGEVKKYLDWIVSAAGQKVVAENKFVPLN